MQAVSFLPGRRVARLIDSCVLLILIAASYELSPGNGAPFQLPVGRRAGPPCHGRDGCHGVSLGFYRLEGGICRCEWVQIL